MKNDLPAIVNLDENEDEENLKGSLTPVSKHSEYEDRVIWFLQVIVGQSVIGSGEGGRGWAE